MLRALRVILAMVVVCLGLILTVEVPASADCTCRQGELSQQIKKADVVFIGTIDSVVAEGNDHTYSITATRAYLGSPERSTRVVSLGGPKACGLGDLGVGATFVFFASGDQAPYKADSCGGTSTANPTRVSKIENILGEGKSVDPPPPPKATVTKVEGSAPPGFARLAAPGAAAAIIGLLGLFVVRRLARR